MTSRTMFTKSQQNRNYKTADDFFQACQLTSLGQEPNRMLPTPAHVTNDELEEILPMYLELLYDRVNYRHLFDILENTKVDHKAGHAAAVLLFYPLVVQRERIQNLTKNHHQPLPNTSLSCGDASSTCCSITKDNLHMLKTNNFPLQRICHKILTDRNILKWCRGIIGLESVMYEALLILRCTLLLNESVHTLNALADEDPSSSIIRSSGMRDVFLPGCSPYDDANALRELIRELSVVASREEMQYYSPFGDIAVDFLSALGKSLMNDARDDLRVFVSEEIEATTTLLVTMRQISEDYDDSFRDELSYYQLLSALEKRLLHDEESSSFAMKTHQYLNVPVPSNAAKGNKYPVQNKKIVYSCNGPDCGQVGSLLKCSGCNAAMYCSKECQRADWNEGGHKAKCAKSQQKKKKRMANLMKKTEHEIVVVPMQQDHSITKSSNALNPVIDLPKIASKNGNSKESKMEYLQIIGFWVMAFSLFLFKADGSSA